MAERKDLTGKMIGKYHVDKYLGKKKYLCTCTICGNQKEVAAYNLRKNLNNPNLCCKQCTGKMHKMVYDKGMIGRKFGDLTVIKRSHDIYYLCKCKCGREEEINRNYLLDGSITACKLCRSSKGMQDLRGKTFGDWEVIGLDESDNRRTHWICRCKKCGRTVSVIGYNLTSGHTTSCGCDKQIDLTGKQFGHWKVLEYVGNEFWKCKCDCGTIKNVHSWELRTGQSTSCGCQRYAKMKATSIEKYGDIFYKNIDSPRTEEQINAYNSYNSLRDFIDKHFENNIPTTKELADTSGINVANTLKKIHKINAENLVKIGESTEEKTFYEFIYSNTSHDVIRHDRSLLGNLEIDVYIPDLRLAFEYDGDLWHSDIYKDKDYHRNKSIRCANKNVQLIHVYEHEWVGEDRNKIELFIKDKLNENKEKVYARNTEIKHLGIEEANEFIDKYHLQKSVSSNIAYGLYYNNDLIQVMTFCKPRFSKEYEWEILREVTKSGIIVVGGTEKLLSAFKNEYNPRSIITYVNFDKFIGISWLSKGFKKANPFMSDIDYVWVSESNPSTYYHRYDTMKQKLIKAGLCTEDQTEDAAMRAAGFLKVYGCGNLRYQYIT